MYILLRNLFPPSLSLQQIAHQLILCVSKLPYLCIFSIMYSARALKTAYKSEHTLKLQMLQKKQTCFSFGQTEKTGCIFFSKRMLIIHTTFESSISVLGYITCLQPNFVILCCWCRCSSRLKCNKWVNCSSFV